MIQQQHDDKPNNHGSQSKKQTAVHCLGKNVLRGHDICLAPNHFSLQDYLPRPYLTHGTYHETCQKTDGRSMVTLQKKIQHTGKQHDSHKTSASENTYDQQILSDKRIFQGPGNELIFT